MAEQLHQLVEVSRTSSSNGVIPSMEIGYLSWKTDIPFTSASLVPRGHRAWLNQHI
jgi:hypothetical protein